MNASAALIIAAIWLAVMGTGLYMAAQDTPFERAYDECVLQCHIDVRLKQPARHCAAGPAYGEDAL